MTQMKKQKREFLKLEALQKSKPAVLRLKTDIYVNRNPCFDCKGFQKRVNEVTGIGFNIIFIPSKRPASQHKGESEL
jgi:hypothetical protein